MPLLYLPSQTSLFLWEDAAEDAELGSLGSGEPHRETIATPTGVCVVDGLALPLLITASRLATVPAQICSSLPASWATWVLASKLALELVARERVVPTLTRANARIEARWAAALSATEDLTRVAAIARSMPPGAHALPLTPPQTSRALAVWSPDALLRAFLDATVDALLRASGAEPALTPTPRAPVPRSRSRATVPNALDQAAWPARWRAALTQADPTFEPTGFQERSVFDTVTRWAEPALAAHDRLRACFRLEVPLADGETFTLRFLLQPPDDPSLLVLATEVWQSGRGLKALGRAFKDPQESLLASLSRAARLFPAIARSLAEARPDALALDPAEAWSFLEEGAAALSDAGFAVIVPGELTAAGQRRLKLRMRVGNPSKSRVAGVATSAGLSLDSLVNVDWEAVIGDETLTARELAALAKHKAPLVRFRGEWVAIDPRELPDIQRRIAAGPKTLTLSQAVMAALAGDVTENGHTFAVTPTGTLATLLDRLSPGGRSDRLAPVALNATLRPYQLRGLDWLSTMASLGLGACLADDMGLGKTIQFLAFLLRRVEDAANHSGHTGHPDDQRPTLLVAPTSVIGNWQREVERFAPSLQVVQHYGPARATTPRQFPRSSNALILTTYGLLRRDADLLTKVDFATVALDEAQNIKNAASITARVARALSATHRFALTGTPVENRLAELWSILEFANPGLLGPLESFRKTYAIPIERFGDDHAALRLRKVSSPFILRRLKSDPLIIDDLPAKHEMKVLCTLTREQVSLYKAVVDEELRRIAESDGIERRGRVLALLTFTKQICNHPAQYLTDSGPLDKRSGKLTRLTEMLEETLSVGDRSLVFTQFREMGDRLVKHLAATFGVEVAFLHGGTSKKARDELVRRFQQERDGPSIFVLSLKAGGTGLNLTAANHVFHYDRWWNPAVEDQATDRAYRIGQKRSVQVHKFVCAGTVEDRIDQLLTHKRELASKVVGTGEQWITELGASELRDLFALSDSALSDDDDEAAIPSTPRKKSPPRPSKTARYGLKGATP